MALSAQTGYIVPLKKVCCSLKKVKLMTELTMLRVENIYNKPLQ